MVVVAARAHVAARDDYVLLRPVEPGRDTARQPELERQCILDGRVRRRMSLVWEAGGSVSDNTHTAGHDVINAALRSHGRRGEVGHRATNAEGTDGDCD